jgi:glutathione S-transferase
MSELDAHTLYIVRRHVGLSHLYGEAPDAVAAAKAYFAEQLAAAAPTIPEQGCLFGERLSVADILLTSCLDWAASYGIALPERAALYHARMTARPAYGEADRRNDPASLPADAVVPAGRAQ